MKYLKEIKEFGKLGTDFYNIEVWIDYYNRESYMLYGCSKRKKNVDKQLKIYKDKIAIVLGWDKENNTVKPGNIKDIRILINGVTIDDIDNWELEMMAKKYNL